MVRRHHLDTSLLCPVSLLERLRAVVLASMHLPLMILGITVSIPKDLWPCATSYHLDGFTVYSVG